MEIGHLAGAAACEPLRASHCRCVRANAAVCEPMPVRASQFVHASMRVQTSAAVCELVPVFLYRYSLGVHVYVYVGTSKRESVPVHSVHLLS